MAGMIRKMRRALESHDIFGLRFILDAGNFYNRGRVLQVGPDQAAAEWIVRCGGSVKFRGIKQEFSDYSVLIRRLSAIDPAIPDEQVFVERIDATDAGITGYGCEHLDKLMHLREVKMIGCYRLGDNGLEIMGNVVRDRLPHLHIESCDRLSEYGLVHLKKLTGLETLKLIHLRGVHEPDRVLKDLQKALPNCDISYPDVVEK